MAPNAQDRCSAPVGLTVSRAPHGIADAFFAATRITFDSKL